MELKKRTGSFLFISTMHFCSFLAHLVATNLGRSVGVMLGPCINAYV